jgi:hypothetical protein
VSDEVQRYYERYIGPDFTFDGRVDRQQHRAGEASGVDLCETLTMPGQAPAHANTGVRFSAFRNAPRRRPDGTPKCFPGFEKGIAYGSPAQMSWKIANPKLACSEST